MPQKIVAFVARSFDPADEAKIDPIIKLLDSFKSLGFIAESADRGEVESVSEKVRSLIDKSQVFVGIFTQRHRFYRFNGRWKTAWNALWEKLTPTGWSAPPWVLQESGYALKANKDLVLFRETGVEIPGLQGDLEYISFDARNPMPALQRANEMITSLIAKAGGIKVETVVQSEAAQTNASDVAQGPKPSNNEPGQKEGSGDEETFRAKLIALWKAVRAKEWASAEQLHEQGLIWIATHKPDEEVFWKCAYQRWLFLEGKTGALAQLRELAAEYEAEFLPLQFLGNCLRDLHEYEEALKCYTEATALAEPEQRASVEILAAGVLQKMKRAEDARQVLVKLREAEYSQDSKTQFEVLKALYTLSSESGDKLESFAIGELAMHQSPENTSFRFSLAFDYDKADQSQMALYHCKILCEQDESYSSAMNNLGVASAKCDLPVLAAQRYKRAYELGDTLAASNLGRRLSGSGFIRRCNNPAQGRTK